MADEKKLWVFDVDGIEWVYAMHQLYEYVAKRNNKTPELNLSMFGTKIHVEFERSTIPVEYLSKMTGISPEALEAAETITLTVKPKPELPEPTVNYWGLG